ncbi:MAG: 1-acyl-sn-glycerol-3-phosphate acyltransferase, partial [Acidobacteriota bacterium]
SIIKANAVEADVIHPSMNLEIDLGLDSLARAEAFAATEHAFSKEFSGDEAAQALTVRDVIDLVSSSVSATDSSESGKIQRAATAATSGAALTTDFNWSTIIKTADEDIPELRSALKNRPLFLPIAFVAYKCFNLFCRVFMQLEVHGLENLRSMKRPFLICPNHQSFLDPFVLCSTYPLDFFKKTFHVGASEFFQTPLMVWIAQMLHVVPVDPDTQLMKAMKASAIGLNRGWILNIYPEGERAYDGELHKFKKGAAVLATELQLPILPVAIDGLHRVWPRHTWRIRPAKVKIKIGTPFYASEVSSDQPSDGPKTEPADSSNNVERSTNNEQTYEAVTAHLKKTIEGMIEEMRK